MEHLAQERYSRQYDFIKKVTPCTVVGAGAIGRNVAIQLAQIGVTDLQVADFDTVEIHNTASQGYLECDIGLPKVEALGNYLALANSSTQVELVNDRWRPSFGVNEALFLCVDSIQHRANIFRWCGGRIGFLCDGRMLGEHINVLAFSNADIPKYEETLFPSEQAEQGSCTGRTIGPAAHMAASLMVHQYTRWLRDLPVDNSFFCNMVASGYWCE